jgi:nitroreductase
VAVTERERLEKLSKLGEWAGHIAGAGMAVVIFTPDPGQRFSIMFDAGQSASYMQLAAWELGVGSCLATMYQFDEVRKLLCVPPEWHARIAISFGYPADESDLSRPPKTGGRAEFSDVVHFNRWEDTACDE